MSVHPIDDLFKKRFSNHEEPYPEHIWKKVDEELHGRGKNRRGGAWIMWSALAALLLISIGTAAYFINDGNSPTDKMEVANEIENTSLANQEDKTDVERGSAVTGNVVADKNSGNEFNQITDKGNTDSREELEKIISNQQTNTNSGQKETMATTSNIAQGQSSRNPINTSASENGNTQNSKYASSLEKSFIQSTTNTKNSLDDNPTYAVEVYERSTLLIEKLLTQRSNNDLLDMLDDETDSHRNLREHLAEDFGYGKNKIRIRWSMGLVYGFDLNSREIESRNSDGEGLAYYRKNHERLFNAFTIGAEINLLWHNWSLKTGMHYSQVNDLYEYTVDNSEQIVSGQSVFGTETHSIVNRYKSYEIPVWVGYEWSRNQWSYGIHGGLNMGINYQVTGQVFDDASLSVVDLKENGGYRSSLGVIPAASIQIGYKLGYNSTIFVRPTYKHYMTSLSKESYLLDHSQRTLSITAGLRYRL